MSAVLVKARAGNRSAQLVQSMPVKVGRRTRLVPMCIGSVSAGADIGSGTGFRFNAGFSLDTLDAVARQKVEAWLATAAATTRGDTPTAEKVTMANLASKLDELLQLVHATAAAPACTEVFPVPALVAPAASAASAPAAHLEGSALDHLEGALMAAVKDLAEQVKVARGTGASLTNQRHAGSEPAGRSALDKLQARANYLRRDVLPRFEDACKTLELMVSKGAKTVG